MSTVELAAGDEIERCDEEADPSGDEDGVRCDVIEGGNRRIPLHQDAVNEADGEGFAAEDDEAEGALAEVWKLSAKPMATAMVEAK